MNPSRNNSAKPRSDQRSFGNRDGAQRPRSNQGRFGANRNSNFRSNNFSQENREMHKTVCTKCNKPCEVPFKPTEGKPVFCKDCFMKEKRY